jgi:hypothetical protein
VLVNATGHSPAPFLLGVLADVWTTCAFVAFAVRLNSQCAPLLIIFLILITADGAYESVSSSALHLDEMAFFARHSMSSFMYANIGMVRSAGPKLALATVPLSVVAALRCAIIQGRCHAATWSSKWLRRARNVRLLALSGLIMGACSTFLGGDWAPNIVLRITSECAHATATSFFGDPALSFINDELAFLEEERTYFLNKPRRQDDSDVDKNQPPPPALFVFHLESLRASAFPAYNPKLSPALTPYLSHLVESSEAAIVQKNVAAVSNTMKNLFASMCGVPPHPGLEVR